MIRNPEIQFASADAIAAFQEERLRDEVAYLYENSPYYRRMFDGCGMQPGDIRTADDLRQGRLGSAEVKQALGAFPKDPVLLNAAAARALQQGEFAAALELAERNRAAGGNNPGILFQLLAAREGLGKLDEVSAEFGAARRKQPEDTALADLYLSFCVRNRRAGELKQLAEELRQAKTPELRVLALAAEAESALLKQDSAAAEKLCHFLHIDIGL
mgnify:CR=1 FL=1